MKYQTAPPFHWLLSSLKAVEQNALQKKHQKSTINSDRAKLNKNAFTMDLLASCEGVFCCLFIQFPYLTDFSLMTNEVCALGVLSQVILPPCCSTIVFAMARPSP